MHSAGLPEPTPCVVTSSFLLTYGVVRESDALAPVATAVADILRDMPDHPGEITTLRTQVPIEVETYLLLTRRGQTLTPAAQMVMNLIKKRVGTRS
jgi:hypothetical protein